MVGGHVEEFGDFTDFEEATPAKGPKAPHKAAHKGVKAPHKADHHKWRIFYLDSMTKAVF